MKKLLIALGAAVAVSTVFARVTTQQGFESDYASDFVADGEGDESAVAEYGTTPAAAAYPFSDFGSKYLDIDTGDTTLWCTNSGDATYFDMYMQFNPCSSAPELENDTKLAVYLDASSNLYVMAGGGSTAVTNLNPGTWARLTVAGGDSFKVYLDGGLLGEFSSRTGDASVKTVGFKGSGALDNYVARTTDPLYVGEYAASIGTGNGSEKFATCAEALTEALKYGGSITRNLLGASAQDGSAAAPFQISDVDTLKAFQAAAAEGYGLDKCYVQTADIDMTSAGAFAGIGTYAKVPTSGKPFVGTYDGQGYTISNVQRAGGDTQGIFNQVGVGGVVENLVVSNMYWDAELSGEYGFAIVGNAGGGATLRNLTAEGTFASAAKPSTHNIAGIVVRVCGGATADVATTIDSCTNNATIYGGYTKLGGICAIVQQQTGFADGKVVFNNCANNGNLVCLRTSTGVTGNAGIIGYSSANNVELTGCYGNGVIINESGANTDKDAALIGYQYSNYTVKDNGGNSAPADKKMIATYGNATKVTGFQYATVANGVATTVTTLEAGNTYLLEGNVAASETPVFTLEAVGDTIAFNTNGYVFAGTVAAAGDMVDAVPSTVDAVITYTATAAPVVATITKGGNTTSYRTLQAAIEDAVSGDTVNLVGAAAGAVNIPAGITVQLVNGYSLAAVTSLAGEGVLKMPWGESPQPVHQLLCQQTTWAGTLYIQGVDIGSAINLTLLGNVNSTVCFNNAGCAFTTGSTTAHAIKALEIGPNGLDFIGEYGSGTFTFPCALTGTGMLKIAAKNSSSGTALKVAKFTGDVSGFAGSINFDANANCAVYFGETAGNGNCISVAADKSVTVAAGKTWTAPAGFVVQGSMTVNGTLDGGNKLYGSGTITFNAATSLVVANTWTGTYNANFKAANNAIFYIPVNASATTVINGANGEFGGYPNYNGGAPTVAGPVTLNANWTVANGWTGTDYTTTFAKLSGSGNLTVDGTTSGTDPIYYTITELDNYTGTIGGARGNFTIGKVNVATAPADGARVVATAIGANGSINNNVPLFVAGVDSGKVLEYNANGADGAGLYVKASAPVTPTIDPATDTPSAVVAAEGEDAAIAAVEVAAPTGVDAATYKANFDFSAEDNGDGTFTVTLTGIKDEVKEDVSEDAVDVLTSDTGTGTVDVPAGLYYRVTRYTAIGTAVDELPVTGQSDGKGVSVSKPGTTQGFIKVEMATKPLN